MPRLLHVTSDLDHGGAATQLRLLAEAGLARGDEVAVATLRRPGPGGDRLTQAGAPVTWLGGRFKVDPFAMVAFDRVLRRWRPDVLQSWDLPSAEFCQLAKRLRGVAWVHTLRGGPVSGSLRRADRLLAADVVAAAAVRSLTAPVDIVPNAFDPAIEPASPEAKLAVRARLRAVGVDLPDLAPVILCVTRMEDPAATKEIAWACDLVRVVVPGLRLLVVGDGPARMACQRFAAKATERGTVHWLRSWDDLTSLYAAADVVWCGLGAGAEPTPAVEAMAAGKPLVLADGPGRESLMPYDPASGRPNCRPAWDDRSGWARATMRLLDGHDLAGAIANDNAQRVRTTHSLAAASAAHATAIGRIGR